MKALTVRQPWAWLIIRPDLTDPEERARELAAGRIKTLENRTWASKHCGPLAIHAAASCSAQEYRDVLRFLDSVPALRPLRNKMPDREDLALGGIIGVVNMTDCVSTSALDWYMGAKAFVLADARPLPFTPIKGALSMWRVPDEVVIGLGLQP